jgi:hypothetical protein
MSQSRNYRSAEQLVSAGVFLGVCGALAVTLGACAAPTTIVPSRPEPLPAMRAAAIDTTPKERRRMMPPEVYLRAYLVWQTNTLMLATLGRLGEALCIRAAEHDLHGKPAAADRVVFAFEPIAAPSDTQFAERFDVLHRLFLGYPARLAPPERVARYFALYREVAAEHAGKKKPALTADETAWAAVCTALVQHPEAELY